MGLHGFESFQKKLENSEVAMPITVELLTLEVLHRIIVCVYEVSYIIVLYILFTMFKFVENFGNVTVIIYFVKIYSTTQFYQYIKVSGVNLQCSIHIL